MPRKEPEEATDHQRDRGSQEPYSATDCQRNHSIAGRTSKLEVVDSIDMVQTRSGKHPQVFRRHGPDLLASRPGQPTLTIIMFRLKQDTAPRGTSKPVSKTLYRQPLSQPSQHTQQLQHTITTAAPPARNSGELTSTSPASSPYTLALKLSTHGYHNR